MGKTQLRGPVGLLWIFSLADAGPKPNSAAGGDPFIGAIETVKRSVASLDCLSVSGSESRILERVGSAFLLSATGDFLTAAHVIAAMQNPEGSCPTPALTFPAGDWHPGARTEDMRWFPFQASRCRMDPSLDIALRAN